MNGKSKLVLLPISAWLSVACSSGPTFTDAPQSNAAILQGPVVPTQGAENGNCSVVVEQVDGLHSNFTASREGLNWPEFNGVKPLLLAATKHELALNISYVEAAGRRDRDPRPQGPGGPGSNCGIGEYKATSRAEIFAAFEAGHVYRVTADLEDESISVVLWDETKGAGVRAQVADWNFNCPRTDSEATGPKEPVMQMSR
jgi:hypothetical protein